MKYEDILREVGGWGRYQKLLTLWIVLSSIPNGFFTMVSVFIMDSPEHHCRVKIDNETSELQIENKSTFLNDNIPFVKEDGQWIRSHCEMFNSSGPNRTTTGCDDGWTFYPSYGEETIVMEWNLVCDERWVLPMVVALYMSGVLVGSFISGALADRFGRRPVFLWGTLGQFLAMFVMGLSTNPDMLAAFMFLSGCTSLLNYVAAFVIITEIVEYDKRSLVGSLEITGFTIGYMLLPLGAYFLSNWRWILWFMGGAGVFYIPYYWLIPESPRWLIMNGRPQAKALIRKIAKVNKAKLSEDDFLRIEKEMQDCASIKEIENQFSYLDLFKHPTIRYRSLIMFFIWFSTSMTYYCISFGTSNLGGNKFVNCFVSAAVELPAYFTSLLLMEKFGRKSVLIAYLVIGGSFCAVASAFLKVNEVLVITSAMVSKFACSAVFSIIYIYCCELFPTKMRNMSVGASSTMARIGGIVAPYIIYAGKRLSPVIPYIVMGGFAIASGILTLFLPETLNKPLPDTIGHAIKIKRENDQVKEKKKNANDVLLHVQNSETQAQA